MNLPAEHALYAAFALVLLLAVASDLRSQRIPNLLTFPAALAALVFHGIAGGWAGLWFGLAGLLLGLGLMLVPYTLGVMGAGDVKLAAAAGAVLGWKAAVSVLLLTGIAGAAYALLMFAVHHRWSKEWLARVWGMLTLYVRTRQWVRVPPSEREAAFRKPKLCYGVAIAAGCLWTIGSLVWTGSLPISV